MGGRERGCIAGARDGIAQLGRGARAMVKKIALGDHSERRSGRIRDTQVPDPETIHASQRTVDHLVAGHRVDRRAHHRRHRCRVGVDARIRGGSQQIALGDDAGGPRLHAADEERADSPLGHDSSGFANRPVRWNRPRGRAHHFVKAAQVEKAVDTDERLRRRRFGGIARHRMPPRLHFAGDQIRSARGERFRLAEGPHVHLSQARHERGKDFGRGEAVAQRIVPRLDGDAEPVRERLQPEVDESAIERAREMRDIQSRRIAPGHVGSRRLVAQHREVEADVLADDHASREHFRKRTDRLRESRCIHHLGVGDAVNPGRRGRNRNLWVDAGMDTGLAQHHGTAHRHRADLDDAVVRHIQSGGFQIEGNRGQGREPGMSRWPVGARHRGPGGVSRTDGARRWSRRAPHRSRQGRSGPRPAIRCAR